MFQKLYLSIFFFLIKIKTQKSKNVFKSPTSYHQLIILFILINIFLGFFQISIFKNLKHIMIYSLFSNWLFPLIMLQTFHCIKHFPYIQTLKISTRGYHEFIPTYFIHIWNTDFKRYHSRKHCSSPIIQVLGRLR